jgi:hypothetical protein
MSDIKTTGALFITDKQGNANRPDYNGDFKLTQEFLAALTAALGDQPDCKVKLAGWKKQGQKGPYLSLSVQPPFRRADDERGGLEGASDPQGRPAARKTPELDDDIPF